MNIDKYMKKAYGFFAKTKKEQKAEVKKLKKIVAKFESAQKKLNKEITETTNKKLRDNKQKELQIVEKLLKKVQIRLNEIISK